MRERRKLNTEGSSEKRNLSRSSFLGRICDKLPSLDPGFVYHIFEHSLHLDLRTIHNLLLVGVKSRMSKKKRTPHTISFVNSYRSSSEEKALTKWFDPLRDPIQLSDQSFDRCMKPWQACLEIQSFMLSHVGHIVAGNRSEKSIELIVGLLI